MTQGTIQQSMSRELWDTLYNAGLGIKQTFQFTGKLSSDAFCGSICKS